MGGYGYSYRSYSSYSGGELGRIDETSGPLLRKPFVPFVFGRNSDGHLAPNTNQSSEAEGSVTRKKIVPVASPPYDYGDEYKHSSPPPNQAYPARNDEGWRRQPSPPHGRPQIVDDLFNKIQIEASKPSKFVPAYGGANGYGDSGNFSNKPSGNTVRNDKYDGYGASGKYGNQDSGYGGGGDYGKKERYKPTVSSIPIDARGYGDSGKYGNQDSGYGGGDYGKKEGYKPTVSSIPMDARGYGDSGKYGNQDSGYGGGDCGKKEGYKPTVSSIPINARGYCDSGKYGNQDSGYGSGDYGKKEGYKPTVSSIPMDARGYGDSGKYGNQDSNYGGGDSGKKEGYKPTVSSIPIDARGYGDSGKYGSQGNGYGGDYGNKEGYKPTVSPIRNDNYDGYNDASRYSDQGKYGNKENGLGGDYGNHGKKEGYKPTGSTVRNDNGYNGTSGYGDYGKYSNTEGHKPTGNTTRNDNSDRHQAAGNYSAVEPNKATTVGGWTRSGNGGHLTEATNDIGKAMELLKEAGNAKGTRSEPEPTNKIGRTIEPAESVKNIGIAPSQSRVAVAIEGTTPNKDSYTDSSSREATGRNGNFNFTTRQRTSPPPNTNMNKTSDVPRRFGKLNLGRTINSEEAERIFNGTRI